MVIYIEITRREDMAENESMQKRAETLNQQFNSFKSTMHAVQRINRWKGQRYDHEFLKRVDKVYFG